MLAEYHKRQLRLGRLPVRATSEGSRYDPGTPNATLGIQARLRLKPRVSRGVLLNELVERLNLPRRSSRIAWRSLSRR